MRLAPGWRAWVLTPAVLGLILGLSSLAWSPLWIPALGFGVLAAGVAYFFRDPDREIAAGITAAADGLVRSVRPEAIVTFLNVHDVHVVRAPYAGRVTRVHRFEGGHVPAFMEGSEHNAGLAVSIDTRWGVHDVHLLAGTVARRAVAWVERGDEVAKGERIGMIRLGSRVDVDLPPGSDPAVSEGDRVLAGSASIAWPPEDEEASG